MRSTTNSSAEQKDPSVLHHNAPLSVEGRRRLVQRCQTCPIAHVAAEMGISRQCASTWVNRYRQFGETGLLDRPSVPHHQPTATPTEIIVRIEQLRRSGKHPARRIALELAVEGTTISVRTVSRHLVHLDVKKVGRIPDGVGWRAHGRGSEQARRSKRATGRGPRVSYTYLHIAIDGFSRLAHTEALPDEKARTAIAFLSRARAFFAAHGIGHIHRIVTDNGSCYKAADFATALHGARHQRITPYTPRHNGKVERYNRILAEEFLHARTWTSEHQRTTALSVWNVHYNYRRPHTAAGNQPPATRLHTGVTNVMASYT